MLTAQLTAQTLALVVCAFALGGFVKGAIGMGLPVIVLALLALIMPLKEAMAIFLIPAVASNIWQASNGPYLPGLARRLWPFLLGAVAGIAVGVSILAGTRSDVMVTVLGVLLILYSSCSLLAPRLPPPGRHERWLSPVAGALGGVIFGMVGVFIVPGLLYLETLRMPRDEFVQGLGLTFVTISAALAVSMAGHSLVTGPLAILSVAGLVPVFAGIWAGRRVRHRISEAFYRRLFFLSLIATGIYMIARTSGAFD
jgi:uncharacterized membrane protein YfcA